MTLTAPVSSQPRLTDPLTGLLLNQGFRLACTAPDSDGDFNGLVLFDVDGFQLINARLGYDLGDEVLRIIAATLRDSFEPDDVIGRIGSNAFAISLERSHFAEIEMVADQVRARIRHDLRSVAPTATISAGIALVSEPDETAIGERLTAAEAALSSARLLGTNHQQSIAVTSELNDYRSVVRLAGELPAMAENGCLHLALQRIPSLRAASQRCELLLRPEFIDRSSYVSPQKVIEAAETFGLTHTIDRWVLRRALALLQSGELSNFDRVAVNLSAASMDLEFCDEIGELLGQAPTAAQRLTIEITETAAVRDIGAAARFMRRTMMHGPTFAIDDFGSGTASFETLRSLPFDTLKIDGRFIRRIVSEPTDVEIVLSFVRVAHSLGIRTVAEQAETAAQVAALRTLGVDYVQGFAMHRPELVKDVIR